MEELDEALDQVYGVLAPTDEFIEELRGTRSVPQSLSDERSPASPSVDRGWTRADLYERGRADS